MCGLVKDQVRDKKRALELLVAIFKKERVVDGIVAGP